MGVEATVTTTWSWQVRAQILGGLAISAVCLFVAFANVPFGDVARALGTINLGWLGLAASGQVAVLLARARRWQVLLSGRVGYAEIFWAQAVGLLGTNVFPLRAGEAARVLIVSRRADLPLARVGASVVLERTLDVAVILGLLVCLMPFVRVPTAVQATSIALAAVLGVGGVGICVLVLLGDRAGHVLALIARRLPGRGEDLLRSQGSELIVGLQSISHPATALGAVGWSLVTWAGAIGTYWAAIEAVVPGAKLIEAAFAIAAVSIGLSIPSSPGFFGVFQLVGQLALVAPFPDRYTQSDALSVALLAHALYYIITSAAGVAGLIRLGLSFGDARGRGPSRLSTAVPATTP